jgi:anaerobic magnesium-protoporphyrin IX monomethyl ester cyclase
MGILMIATILEKAGYEVHLLDSNAVMKKRNIDDIIRIATKLKPDIIGMTLITPTIKESYKLASRLKDIGAKLIAGGPHATIMPDEVIAHGFDAAVIGEGEDTVEEAIKSLLGLMPKDEVLGWVYKNNNGQAIHTKPRPLITNLDELPLPARHLIEPSDYGGLDNPKIHMNIFSSRGCPAKCAYCAGGLFGKKFRFRSSQKEI